jgi:hypothetical protein
MSRKKIILITVIMLLSFIIATGFILKNRVQTQVKELFRMNKTLQEEGYYMADFEFKMVGLVYYLDKGSYFTALSRLSDFHRQLQNRENLIKVPEFKSKEEEIEFYLNLQNPRTGAFMDDSFPHCTFNEPTENVIIHLDALAKETGTPLRLKYPLKYLDVINTPEKLYAFLDDVSYIGWIGSKFPQTSYLFARSLVGYYNGEGVIGISNLYSFSPEYKAALLSWFCNNQDSTTGFWGPKSRNNGQLLNLDLTNTASIIKTYVDRNGNDIHEAFPLKYRHKLFESTLKVLSEPVPPDDEIVELHEWNLKMTKGIMMLLRYLWKDATGEEKQKAKTIIENYIKIKFEKYYVPKEGAFSYYPGGDHASLDGTGGLIFKEIGAFSAEKQKKLWGDSFMNIKDLGQYKVTEINNENFNLIVNCPDINSLRIYHTTPNFENLTDSVYAVVYPEKSSVLDIMELIPKICKWLDAQSLSIGNWSSIEEIKKEYVSLKIEEPLVFKDTFPTDSTNNILLKNGESYIIGFDILQIPRYKIVYLYTPKI